MLIRPSIRLSVLPTARPLLERFELAADAGFEGIEVEARSGPAEAIKDAADRTGMVVHSVHCLANYALPLSSSDPSILAAGIEATIGAIRLAQRLGAGTLLLIPGVVTRDTTYGEVNARSLEVIGRDILPVAEDHGIVIAIENVWNGFLLSPIDFARYIDDFQSLWVRAYLDVGNIIFGRPEGWIELLGRRICKLHLKDLSFRAGRLRPAKIGAGDIEWAKVRAALDRIGYDGWGVLAEPDQAQTAFRRQLYRLAYSRRVARSIPAIGRAFGPIQTRLVRHLLKDVMGRFRRHIDC